MENKRVLYFDVLKIIAICFAIMGHTHGMILNEDNFYNQTFYAIIESLCKVCVPVFLMVTGALVLDKEYSYKKVLTVAFKYSLLLIFFNFVVYFYFNVPYLKYMNFKDFWTRLLTNTHSGHFWYLYTIIPLYIIIPILQKMVKNFKMTDYIFFIFFNFLFLSFIKFLNIVTDVKICDSITATSIPCFISLLICGNFISKIKISKKYFIISLIVLIIGYFFMFSSMYFPYLKYGEISQKLNNMDIFPVLMMAMAFFYIIRFLFNSIKINSKLERIISIVGSSTLGIYLIHQIFNFDLSGYLFYTFQFNNILEIILIDIIIFTLSFIINMILKCIPGIKKIL